MTDVAPLQRRLTLLFSDSLHIDVPSIDTDLFETGALDSLAFVELLLQLERQFGVTPTCDDLDIANFSSITRIADFVMARASLVPMTADVQEPIMPERPVR